MIECRIDGVLVPLHTKSIAMPTYNAEKLHSVGAWRQGTEQIVEVVSTPESDRVMHFAFDLNRGTSFNDEMHRATLLVDGVEVCDGMVTLLGVDASSLEIINRPPTRSKPLYMRVWEARKADGLDYDESDPDQQLFLAQITKYNIRSLE